MNKETSSIKAQSKIVGEIGPNGFKRFSSNDQQPQKDQNDSLSHPKKELSSSINKTEDKQSATNYDLESDFLFHHLLTLGLWMVYQIVLPILMVKSLLFEFNLIKCLLLGGICFVVWMITFALRTYGSFGPLLLRIVFVFLSIFHIWKCLSMFRTQILLMINQLSLPINHQQLGFRVIFTIFEIIIFLMISNYYKKRETFFH